MAFTGYLRYTTGSTLYAKPLPLNDSAWTDDDVAGSENATLGSYAFASLNEGTEYEVFLQAGGSPANTDLAVGQINSISIDTGTTIPALIGASSGGTGSETYIHTFINNSGVPVVGVQCYVTSDSTGGTKVTGNVYSNNLGKVMFNLNPGTYYLWPSHTTEIFTFPITITVTDV